ncbi:MAG TPA: glycoside hydrolase family 76 protein [Solirubrobacteraceae bacterium]|nr:glycoside hydrolase family 76 protein [Solirubrobacteraceae bacterium]
MLGYEAMQQNFYLPATGLYKGEPEYSFLWPFSQALAATVSLAHLPGQQAKVEGTMKALTAGLQVYLGAPGAPPGEATATGASTAGTLRSFDGVVAPPVGPGGASYYDDNEWVGIELARIYELDHNPAALVQAEQIMEFVMAGWQTAGQEGQQLPCPGGLPFSNAANNTQRNTVTDGPAAELGVQLYRITHEVRYLQFAEMSYGWVRECLLEPGGLYADHIELDGEVNRVLWSYNQGSMMGAGALLYQATHNGLYLYQARQTAKAALAYYTYSRLSSENPFFVEVYFRNLIYLDSVTHDPPGALPAKEYAYYAWQRHRLSDNLFAYGSPPTAELLGQASLVQIYALLSIPPGALF